MNMDPPELFLSAILLYVLLTPKLPEVGSEWQAFNTLLCSSSDTTTFTFI